MSLLSALLNKRKPVEAKNKNGSYTFDPLSDEFINNPYPLLAKLRKEKPLCRTTNGAWLLTRYQDVKNALADDRLSNAPSPFAVVHERNKDKYQCSRVANNILPFIDPPVHTAKREVISKSFFQANKEFVDWKSMRALASCMLENLKDTDEFDVIHDYGTPFSTEVMCQLMGFPVEDKLTLSGWAEYFLFLFSSIPDQVTLEKINDTLSEFRNYLKSQVQKKKTQPGDDWCSLLIQHNVKNDAPLNDDEIIDNLMLIFADGVENVDRMLGTIVKLLCELPGLRDALLHENALLENFIDESLRLETPVQFIGRITKQDVEFHGQIIKADSVILLMLGSANRDETQFTDPDQFLLERDNRTALTFGRGTHTCLGRALVRQQLTAALFALLEAYPDFIVTEQVPTWEKRLAHRWLTGLKICIH